MKKVTFAAIAASVLAALTIGLAAPAVGAPAGPNGTQDTVTTVQGNGQPVSGETPYGTYQNDHKRQSH